MYANASIIVKTTYIRECVFHLYNHSSNASVSYKASLYNH